MDDTSTETTRKLQGLKQHSEILRTFFLNTDLDGHTGTQH